MKYRLFDSSAPSLRRWITSSILTALCLQLSLFAFSQAPSGPLLGSKPAGIIDEKDQVVGGGKSLNIFGAGQKTTAADPKQRYFEALLWLRTFLDSINDLEKDMVKIKMALRTAAIEIKDLREYIQDLQRTRDKAKAGGPLYDYCDKLIKEKQNDLKALQAEQDDLLAKSAKRWAELNENLSSKIGESAEFPDFQKGLKDLQGGIGQKRQLSEMEVQLAAGRSEEFRRLAVAADQNPSLRMPVLLMRVSDYMERGEGRLALYAARLGMQTYPEQAAFRSLHDGMAASYLRMISAKAGGDAAEVHNAWNKYAGEVDGSFLKRVFSGSPRHALDILTGKEFDLEQTQKDAMVKSVAEHNGIELMTRLMDKSRARSQEKDSKITPLSMQEIKAMSADELLDKMNTVFDPKTRIEYIDVLPLHRSLQASFYNPDVKRLMSANKSEFDVDIGKSYYGASDFDTGMLEYAADAVNVKNALLFFGPGAVLKYGTAEAGLLSRMSRLGVSEGSVSTAFEGAQTVRDALLATPTMQKTASFLGSTRAGKGIMAAMETARYLRYDASGPVRFATGLAEAFGQMAFFEAGGKVGHALGGDLGEFLGQAAVMMAGNPIADLQAKEAKTLAATAEKMAKTRAQWEATNEILKEVRLPIRGSVTRLNSAEARSQQAIQELEGFIAKTEQASTVARAAAKEQGSPILQAAADEADALGNAAKAAKAGNAPAADAAVDVATSLENEGARAAANLEKAKNATETISKSVVDKRPGTSVIPKPPEGGVPGEPHVDQVSELTGREQTSTFTKNAPPPVEPPPSPKPTPTSPTAKESMALGDDAMRAKNFEEAKANYRSGFEKTVEDLRNPNLGAAERQKLEGELGVLKEKVREARQAVRFEASKPDLNKPEVQKAMQQADEAMKPFTPEQQGRLKQVEFKNTETVSGTTGGPRKVYDPVTGELLGYWKPQRMPGTRALEELNEDGQMIAEVLMSRIGRFLGLRVPHAEPFTLRNVRVLDDAGVLLRTEDVPGVLVRNIADSKQLLDFTPGARMAMKEQIAKFRALQVFMGNFDIHMGNYMVDRGGRVWAIDAGNAMITNPQYRIDMSLGNQRLIDAVAPMPHIQPSGDQTLDWSRVWRDWYEYAGGNAMQVQRAKDVGDLERLFIGKEMRDVATDIRKMTDADLKKLVDEVMPGHSRAKDVFDTLKARRDSLHNLLNEKWQGSGGVAPSARLEILTPPIAAVWRWIPQLQKALRADSQRSLLDHGVEV